MLWSTYALLGLKWVTVDNTAAATIDDVPPTYGTHLIYEVQARSDQASTPSNFAVFINGDVTTGNYHFQRNGAGNGAAVATEGTTAAGVQGSGDTSVAGFYSPIFLLFPWFRSTTRNKVCLAMSFNEAAALNQQALMISHKRQGVSITGAQTDAITAVQFRHATQLYTTTHRRAVIP